METPRVPRIRREEGNRSRSATGVFVVPARCHNPMVDGTRIEEPS